MGQVKNIASFTDLNNLYKKSGEPGVPERYSDSSDKSDEVVIARLQAELEKQRLEHEVAIQTVRRETSGEIDQLKKTIALIRNELEKTGPQYKGGGSEYVASTTDEIRNLKETIINLRAALDEKDHEKVVAVQNVVRKSSDEIEQLRKPYQVSAIK